MKLKQGYISIWFGLRPDTITKGSLKAKQKKLEKLSLFCDYHLEGKRIHIDKVFIPE